MNYVFVAIGAALGGMLRYAIGQFTSSQSGFPWATLGINVAGSLILGIVIALVAGKTMSEEMRLFVGIGFCGGFTTFSTFSAETLILWQSGEQLMALTYVLSSNLLGIAATFTGIKLVGN